MLSPVLYPALQLQEDRDSVYTVFGGPSERPAEIVIASNILAFEAPYRDIKDATEFLFSDLPVMLSHLRYASRFARFPREYQSAWVRERESAQLTGVHLPEKRKAAAVAGFNIEAALTFEAIQEFANLPPGFSVPVYSELLLDAIEALALSDPKKSVLYAAIAVETMAATVLDEEYERLRAKSSGNPKYRFLHQGYVRSAEMPPDPVYEALKTSRRSQLRPLLHELPLYILGRSLLHEKKQLYDQMLALHGKRSEIAHTGEVESFKEGWRANYGWIGATIRDVASVYDWYGVSGRYPVLDQTVFLGAGDEL